MIARDRDVVTHVAAKPATGDSVAVRKLLIALILSGFLLGVRWAQLTRPKVLVQPKPTFTAAAVPTPLPPPAIPPRAPHVEQQWPSYFEFSERSITPRDFDKDGYELTATYPQISSKSSNARAFNHWIKRKVVGYAREFQQRAVAEQRRKARRLPRLWGLNLEYVVYYSSTRIISLRLGRGLMETGQMHPIRYYETINYDLKQHRQLRATDIFKRGYLKDFSTYSRKALTVHAWPRDWMMSGTSPVADNFGNWNIVPDGVLLSFEDYQVGPHSVGQPEIVVPFSVLKGAIRRNVLRTLLVSQ